MPSSGEVAVVIPARDESDRIAATVKTASSLPGVDLVIVVDDGSRDGTAAVAEGAGAIVVKHARSRGKGGAMETGAEAVRLLDREQDKETPRHLLFLDADLGDTAQYAGPLTEPVLRGEADMTIAVFSSTVKLGGHGFVVRLAGGGIQRATGWRPAQPLNGQRCLTRAAYLRVTEVEVPLAHRATGTDWRAQLHRARQFADVGRALARRL
jgi:glycosyltransferase involved in cell wall biosynthesis